MQERVEAEEQVGQEVAGAVEVGLVGSLPFKNIHVSYQSRIDDHLQNETVPSVLSTSGDAGGEVVATTA